ncbi:MAG: anti-sigma factor antagonist, partial [Verrucomicrobia bacterium]|nr:anti-sigma factor antagonist [Verrucomicrobiota bacterium]
EIQLMGLSDRNLELVKNLGLQRLVNLVETLPDEATSTGSKAEGLNTEEQTEDQKKKMLIGAHENLVKIDDENLSKFQDLLRFLKNED